MKFFAFICALLCSPLWATDHVNILVYHHVSENTPASTSVSPAQFREHLQLFKDQGFTVVSLSKALDSITNDKPLPEKAIAITFDDGYRNIYENAWPILAEFSYPFTIFVATDAIDERYGDMLSWSQIKEMHDHGVTIANHSSDHGYLVRYPDRNEAWYEATKANIEHAQSRLEEELGADVPHWFAYPYGEFSEELKTLLATENYVGFAQHSGGFWRGSDKLAIPRFAAAGIYANTKTLLTKLNSHPMQVDEGQLSDMMTSTRKPLLSANLLSTDDMSKALNCFVNGNWQDANWNDSLNFTLQSNNELPEGRHRYNCTAKSKTADFYYWFSKPWLIYLDSKQ